MVFDNNTRLWLLTVFSMLFSVHISGCGLRTVPPIKWAPFFGKEKNVETTDVLIRALRDQDVVVRAEAVSLLGILAENGPEKTKIEVARLLGMALQDRDPGLRLQAIEKLGAMESGFANKYLRGALTDNNPFVRAKVLEVVGQRERTATIPETLTTQLSTQTP